MPSFNQRVGSYCCGTLSGVSGRVAIVASRFNSTVVSRLIDGALAAFERSGVATDQVTLVEVPGAFEIPYAATKLVESEAFQGIVCLGAVIRGETPHFDMVANNVCSAIAQLNLRAAVPVIMGVLTTDTVEQALDRAGLKSGNSGENAAQCLLELINLSRKLPS